MTGPFPDVESSARKPGWASSLRAACREFRSPGPPERRNRALSRAWDLTNTLLLQSLRRHESRLGPVDPEDRKDIASEKSLEILKAVDSGKWDIAEREGGEIVAFVSTVARNGLVDRLRELGRLDYSVDDPDRPDPTPDPVRTPAAARQDVTAHTREFVDALAGCAGKLKPRDRRVWFCRVLLEMASKDIARHPRVDLKAGHVDVLLKRSRESVRDCMRKHGFEPRDLPPGTFTELWFTFGEEIREEGLVHDGGK